MVDLKLAAIAKETIRITGQGFYRKEGCRIIVPGSTLGEGFSEVEVLTEKKLNTYVKSAFCSEKRLKEAAQIYLFDGDSFEMARELEKPLVMNFANALYPGGGFLNGAKAQEESLCRNSTLYASLTTKKSKKMYDYNRKMQSPVESDYMLLSPNVGVIRNKEGELLEEPYLVSVITVPAPNRKGRAAHVEQKELDQVMKRRLRLMLAAAVWHGYKNLVLGAWGCGAFGNDTQRVARLFYELFFEDGLRFYFENVAFAILSDEKKIRIFKEVFGDKVEDLSYWEDEADDGYHIEMARPFPIFNHSSEITKENIGYVQGVFSDGVPFEAELWMCDGSMNVSFVFPELWPKEENQEYLKEGNVLGFHDNVARTNCGVLTIGMVDNGMVSDVNATIAYIEYLKNKGVLEFVSSMENGAVLLVTDIEGNDLAHVIVTLNEDGETLAKTPLCFHDFPNRYRKPGIRVIK